MRAESFWSESLHCDGCVNSAPKVCVCGGGGGGGGGGMRDEGMFTCTCMCGCTVVCIHTMSCCIPPSVSSAAPVPPPAQRHTAPQWCHPAQRSQPTVRDKTCTVVSLREPSNGGPKL